MGNVPSEHQIDTLRGLIRCGEPLTGEQRHRLAQLLDAVGYAVARYGALLESLSR